MILTQEYSRVVGARSTKERAWMVDPQGKIHSCGRSHETYIREHPEEFGGVEFPNDLVDIGWIRVGILDKEFYTISGHRMTAWELSLLQDLAMQAPVPFTKVEVHVEGVGSIYFTKNEFLTASLKDINRSGVTHYSSRRATSGYDPMNFVVRFKWTHRGPVRDSVVTREEAEMIGAALDLEFDEYDGLWRGVDRRGLLGCGPGTKVGIYVAWDNVTLDDVLKISIKDFSVDILPQSVDLSTRANIDTDIEAPGLPEHYYNASRQAALPDSRNMLRDYSMEELTEPLNKAFSLMGLDRDNEYKKLSMPQITGKLYKREKMLQDEMAWNSDDLITELNRFLADNHRLL